MSRHDEPSYLRLPDAEIEKRAGEAVASLACCRICPRNCGADRLSNGLKAVCRTGRRARVSSYHAHFGEEDCLSGHSGSGTIFFSRCNLRCVFCQNYDISQTDCGSPVSPGELADMMIQLQQEGCHNITLVTPSQAVPQILEALPEAIEQGLHVPIVYNTSGYDSVATLRWLDGIVDIYMPDFKFFSEEMGRRYCKAADYGEVARNAFQEMFRQVGDLVVTSEGIALRGLLVRHLVMPGLLAETAAILRFLAQEISPRTYVNVMSQYRPAHKSYQYPEIHERISLVEFREAVRLAIRAGLTRLDPHSLYMALV